MRSPENVLNSLADHSGQSGYTYQRLYRNLYNPKFFYVAYQNIYAKAGNMTKGSDERTIDAMSLKRIDKLDKFIKGYADNFQSGEARRVPPEYTRLSGKIRKRTLKLRETTDIVKRQMLIEEIQVLKRQQLQTPAKDPMDSNFKRLRYERYADDFLIGVIGTKEDCRKIKQDIKEFLFTELHLELSDEKTLITNAQDSARFLGYEISVRNNATPRKTKDGKIRRTRLGNVVLKIPGETIRNRLLSYGALKLVSHNGHEVWKAQSRDYLITQEDVEIILRYNAEIRGLYNYYALAINSGILNNFKHIMQYSMFKTLANKYKCAKKKIIMRMRVGKDFGVKFMVNLDYLFRSSYMSV